MSQDYADENVVIIAAGYDFSPYSCEQWASRYGLTYPLLDDESQKITQQYFGTAHPTSVVIGHDMRVVYRSAGHNETEIRAAIDTALAALHRSTDIHSEPDKTAPQSWQLYPAYPNPFNPSTTLEYDIPHSGIVAIDVYSISGRHITTLSHKYTVSGHHSVIWNGRDSAGNQVSSGLYFIRLNSAHHSKLQKVTLLR